MLLYEAGRIEAFRGDLDRSVELLQAALTAADGGTIPGGGIRRQDIERELEQARRRRVERGDEPPELRWE
jgi:hypothetical protein